MKYSTAILSGLAGVALAEVPQEQSHKQFLDAVKVVLDLNNPFGIIDPVFGLLGDAAALTGSGDIVNVKCLQQITADIAFGNAKAIGDLTGQTAALIFRAIERNTGAVGLKSELCDEIADNVEIAALTQHQDPASDNAAAENKAIALALAQQLALIGADPILALLSGTFPPGEIGDPTAAGFTCNDENDPVGCIFTENLLVNDASIEEIMAAVAEVVDIADVETESEEAQAVIASMMAEAEEVGASAAGVNIQAFAGDLGGPAPAVIQSDNERPFEVNGATFLNAAAALQRSCAVQNNACANAANSGEIEGGVGVCNQQEQECRAQAALRRRSGRFNKIRQLHMR